MITEPLTPRACELIHQAGEFAKRCNHSYIGAEHILIAALNSERGVCPVIRKRLRLSKTIGQRAIRAFDLEFK